LIEEVPEVTAELENCFTKRENEEGIARILTRRKVYQPCHIYFFVILIEADTSHNTNLQYISL